MNNDKAQALTETDSGGRSCRRAEDSESEMMSKQWQACRFVWMLMGQPHRRLLAVDVFDLDPCRFGPAYSGRIEQHQDHTVQAAGEASIRRTTSSWLSTVGSLCSTLER
jgi:hypothetical protein